MTTTQGNTIELATAVKAVADALREEWDAVVEYSDSGDLSETERDQAFGTLAALGARMARKLGVSVNELAQASDVDELGTWTA